MMKFKFGLCSFMFSLMLGVAPAWADVDISGKEKVEVGSWGELKTAVEDSANAGKVIVLTGDIQADADNPIDTVAGAGIIIDGGGFTITGQEGTSDGQFITFGSSDKTDLIIQNVKLEGFGNVRTGSYYARGGAPLAGRFIIMKVLSAILPGIFPETMLKEHLPLAGRFIIKVPSAILPVIFLATMQNLILVQPLVGRLIILLEPLAILPVIFPITMRNLILVLPMAGRFIIKKPSAILAGILPVTMLKEHLPLAGRFIMVIELPSAT